MYVSEEYYKQALERSAKRIKKANETKRFNHFNFEADKEEDEDVYRERMREIDASYINSCEWY